MSRYVIGATEEEAQLQRQAAEMASLRREFRILGALTIAAVAAGIWFLRK